MALMAYVTGYDNGKEPIISQVETELFDECLGLIRDGDEWVVTHQPTGLPLVKSADRQDAMNRARRIADRVSLADDSVYSIQGRINSPMVREIQSDAKNYAYDETTGFLLEAGMGANARLRRNLDAIEVLRRLDIENRAPSAAEKATLSRFVGWGGCSDVFSNNAALVRMQVVMTEEEMSMARSSTTDSFYTPPFIVKAIWEGLRRAGLQDALVLDPSCGIGNFEGFAPADMGLRFMMYDIDPTVAKIARTLNPLEIVREAPFEKSKLPDEWFDACVSNVPFGSHKPLDPLCPEVKLNLHNFFLKRMIDRTRSGGVVAVITSTGTMDSGGEARLMRKQISEQADFLLGVRLPVGTFAEYAGTDVVTDILFFRKKDLDMEIAHAPAWVESVETEVVDEERGGMRKVRVNEYFLNNPSHMLGRPSFHDSMRMGDSLAPRNDGRDLEASLFDIMRQIPERVVTPNRATMLLHVEGNGDRRMTMDENGKPLPQTVRIHGRSWNLFDGDTIASRVASGDGILDDDTKRKVVAMVNLFGLADMLILYMNIRQDLVGEQQVKLQAAYDSFVATWGRLNDPENVLLMAGDSRHGLLLALEIPDGQGGWMQSDIFATNTIENNFYKLRADSTEEALAISLARTGKVHVPEIARLLAVSIPEATNRLLDGYTFRDPGENGKLVTKEEYLSGNVRFKLRQAQSASEFNPAYIPNVEALAAVQPVDLQASEIDLSLGMPLFGTDLVRDFILAMVREEEAYINSGDVDVSFLGVTGTWKVTVQKGHMSPIPDSLNYSTFGTPRYSFIDLVESICNSKTIRIYDTGIVDDKEVRIFNQEETFAAIDKSRIIQERFRAWCLEDPERAQFIAATYNERRNNIVLREWSGAHLTTFPGMTSTITLDAHQKDAVWRGVHENTILVHPVGAGKTFSQQAIAMERKRLGLGKKAMFVVKNANLGQFAADFHRLYPGARLLTVSKDDLPDVPSSGRNESRKLDAISRRRATLSRIATNDWDAVILPYTTFRKIPLSPIVMKKFLQDELWSLEEALDTLKASGEKGWSVKRIEGAKKRLKEKIDRQIADHEKEDVPYFDELGIDMLSVDESHNYKRLSYHTSMSVKGLSTTGSMRAMDLYSKIMALREKPRHRVIFASATPISNTIAELWSIMRFLAHDMLERDGHDHFDMWAKEYANVKPTIEMTAAGEFRMTEYLSSYKNLPELRVRFHSIADVRTKESLNLKVPTMADGKAQIIECDAGPNLRAFQMDIAKRMEKIHNGIVRPEVDNALKCTTDARKAALDLRLTGWADEREPNGKIEAVSRNVARLYRETEEMRGAQMVFCDMGTPKAGTRTSGKSRTKKKAATGDEEMIVNTTLVTDEEDANPDAETEIQDEEQASDMDSVRVYEEIRECLIEEGVRPEEIIFLNSAKSDTERFAMQQGINSGKYRVALGSSMIMGEGINAQERLCAIHHVDVPWTAKDMEQREGRGLRQGNMFEEVGVYRYITPGSADALSYRKIEMKAEFTRQILDKHTTDRRIETVDDTILSYGEAMAIASGDERVIRRTMLKAEVDQLNVLRMAWESQRVFLGKQILLKRDENNGLAKRISKLTQACLVMDPEKYTVDGVSPKENVTKYVQQSVFDALVKLRGQPIPGAKAEALSRLDVVDGLFNFRGLGEREEVEPIVACTCNEGKLKILVSVMRDFDKTCRASLFAEAEGVFATFPSIMPHLWKNAFEKVHRELWSSEMLLQKNTATIEKYEKKLHEDIRFEHADELEEKQRELLEIDFALGIATPEIQIGERYNEPVIVPISH